MARIDINELKRLIEKEMRDMVPASKVKAKETTWDDIENTNPDEVEWMKALNIKELFKLT